MMEIQDEPADLDSVTSEERELAERAARSFHEGNFDEAKKCLELLNDSRNDDIKLKQNWLLLQDVGEKQTAMFHKLFDRCLQNDDIDPSVIIMNTILVYFKAKHYQETHYLLELLQPYTPALSDSVIRDLSLIRMECCLKLNYPEQVPKLIVKIESHLMFNDSSRSSTEVTESKNEDSGEGNTDYKLLVNHYRVKCLLALRSLRACKREIKNLNNNTGEKSFSTIQSILMRTYLEHLRDNGKKAMKILNTLHSETHVEGQLYIILYSNMSCISFKEGKLTFAEMYARKALKGYELHISSGNDHDAKLLHDLLYNLATCHLFNGNYKLAFDIFNKCRRILSRNPQTWLRIAECAIMSHHSREQEKMGNSSFLRKTVGHGKYRRAVLTQPAFNESFECSGGETIKPTIYFAERALRVCVTITDELIEQLDEQKMTFDGPPLVTRLQGLQRIKRSALAAFAYVSLCLGNYSDAIEHSLLLMSNEHRTDMHETLAKLYLAEAYVMQDNFNEAHKALSLKREPSFSSTLPNDSDTETQWALPPNMPWLPQSMAEGKNIFLHNVAVAHALREETKKSEDIVKKLLKSSTSTLVLQLAIYLKLQQGLTNEAKEIVVQHLKSS